MFEIHDPYYDDQQAKKIFGKAEHLAQRAKVARRFVYRQQAPGVVEHLWRFIHPRNIVISAENASQIEDINPDHITYEMTPDGKVTHLMKRW
jgi:hypothetical protein